MTHCGSTHPADVGPPAGAPCVRWHLFSRAWQTLKGVDPIQLVHWTAPLKNGISYSWITKREGEGE